MTNLFDNKPLNMKEVLEHIIKLEMQNGNCTVHAGVLKPLDYTRYIGHKKTQEDYDLLDWE